MREFSRKSSFSKLRTTQKQTIHLSFVSWILTQEKEDFLGNLCFLSCFIRLKSVLFNLLCVFELFLWQQNLLSSYWLQVDLFCVERGRTVKSIPPRSIPSVSIHSKSIPFRLFKSA